MNTIKHYITMAIVLGALQVIDGVLHLTSTAQDIRISFSLLEAIWVAVSMAAIILFKKHSISILIPTAYIAYNLAALTYAGYLMTTLPLSESFVMPKAFAFIAIAFGLFYCTSSSRFYHKTFIQSSR